MLGDISIIHNHLPDVSTGQGHVLLTTRDPNATGIPAQGLEVKVFELQAAVDMLLLRGDLVDTDTNIRSEALKIVTELGFLPLAIEQGGSIHSRIIEGYFQVFAGISC